MNINADFVEGLKKDSYAWYFEEYEKHPEFFPALVEQMTTDAAYEQGTVLTGPGTLDEKTYGEDYNSIGLAEAFTWYCKMREYGNLLPIEGTTIEDIKRKSGDMVKSWSPKFAIAAKNTKETLVANHFNYGGYTAGRDDTFDQSISGGVLTDPSGDGVYTGTAASVKPFITRSGNEWTDPNGDTYYNGLALSPSVANFKTAWELLCRTNAKTESGAEAVNMPETLLCANSTDALLWKEILESELKSGSQNNDKNVLKGLINNIVANPYLDSSFASANAWAIIAKEKPLRLYHRVEPEFDYFEDKKSNTFYGRVRMRIGCTVVNVKRIVASNVPTS